MQGRRTGACMAGVPHWGLNVRHLARFQKSARKTSARRRHSLLPVGNENAVAAAYARNNCGAKGTGGGMLGFGAQTPRIKRISATNRDESWRRLTSRSQTIHYRTLRSRPIGRDIRGIWDRDNDYLESHHELCVRIPRIRRADLPARALLHARPRPGLRAARRRLARSSRLVSVNAVARLERRPRAAGVGATSQPLCHCHPAS
jgi:hypothetical protein